MRARLARAVAEAKTSLVGESIRWVRIETLHLTLRFLGEIAPDLIDRLTARAADPARSWRAFELRVQGLGCFPDPRRPRVIWAGAADGSGRLAAVAADLERIAQGCGLPAEARPFSPHLTLGRVRDRLSEEGGLRLADWVAGGATQDYGTIHVPAVNLYRSELRPTGPVYTVLRTLVMGAEHH